MQSGADGAASASKDQQFVGLNGEITGLGFATRDMGVKSEEQQGLIEFNVIRNDKTMQNMRMLIDLKNIISRQLPKMPKEYIVKLLFDRNHEAMVIVKNKTKIIGGICFRMFKEQRFTEVVFLAVTATEQVKGYGTRLMNKFKECMQGREIEYLLTYADNYAIGYFKKQGFSKEISIPLERWKGYIKDYDGGTMMECIIHPKIDYSNISNIIKQQKQYVIEQVKKLCTNQIRYEGLDESLFDKIQKSKAKNKDGDPDFDLIKTIPGLLEAGWVPNDYIELKKSKERSFQLQCSNIIELMRKHKSSWPFLEPVNKDDVPDYYDIVKEPIDIKTIEKKLQQNYYTGKASFVTDVLKMFQNSRLYNLPETIYCKAANELEEYITPFLQALKDDKADADGETGDDDESSTGKNYSEKTNEKTKKVPGIKKKIKKST